MNKINIALIGYGYWGKIVYKYLNLHTKYNLLSVYSGKNSTTSLSEIAENEDITAVYLATPISTHYSLSKYFLSYNKHVLCEKPLSKKAHEIKEIDQLASINNKIVMINYIYINSASITKMKSLIHLIGDIIYARGEITQFGKFYPEDDVIAVLGCHFFAIITYFFPFLTFNVKVEDFTKDSINHNIDRINIKLYTDIFVCSLYFSLSDINKTRKLILYGSKGILEFNMCEKNTLTYQLIDKNQKITELKTYQFDETNNISCALDTFYENINNNILNTLLAQKVSDIIEMIDNCIYTKLS